MLRFFWGMMIGAVLALIAVWAHDQAEDLAAEHHDDHTLQEYGDKAQTKT